VPLNPRDQFSQLFIFEYANENARTPAFQLREMHLASQHCARIASSRWRFANNFARFFIVA
jgi:hypothetical protein